MPTIQTDLKDFEALLGREADEDTMTRALMWVKGEYKGVSENEETGKRELKIELNDTNRPDTWTPEGIVRQLKGCWGEGYPTYGFLEADPVGDLEVDPSVEAARPFVGAFLARRDEGVDDALLRALIQTQEKLSDTFGQKRKSIAAGIYKLAPLTMPVRYGTIAPDDPGFVPLGAERPMTPAEILAEHETGVKYAACLEGLDRYPILRDADGTVLSMPPIINSDDVGQVEVGDRELFVEFTGPDLETLAVAVNIMAADMADRGFTVERIRSVFPFDTPRGREVTFPFSLEDSVEVTLDQARAALGVELDDAELRELAERYGLRVEGAGAGVKVTAPFYRNDLLHPMDVVEDLAICRGYDSFPRVMPTSYTVGRLSPLQAFADRVRERVVGLGFQEVATPVLTDARKLTERVGRSGEHLVRIANPMTENYAVVRDSLLPTLLEVEEQSYQAAYPHKLFECGEVATRDPAYVESEAERRLGCSTRRALGVMFADADAGFAEIHAVLDALLLGLGVDYRLEARPLPGYMEGRAGVVVARLPEGDEVEAGRIGEVAPVVLDGWGVKVPAAAFELDLGRLLAAVGGATVGG